VRRSSTSRAPKRQRRRTNGRARGLAPIAWQLYVAGLTFSPEFRRAGARASSFRGVVDAFVSKFDPDGRPVYSSYIGGDATDAAHAVAVDRAGNAYVTGRTESTDFPLRNAMKRRLGTRCQSSPCHDAFVTKLGTTGTILYSTFLGGDKNEEGWDIAVDRAGRAHCDRQHRLRGLPDAARRRPTTTARRAPGTSRARSTPWSRSCAGTAAG